jgi:serine/threonine-protein kinase
MPPSVTPRNRIAPTALLAPLTSAKASAQSIPVRSREHSQSIGGFVVDWPQLPDDFGDEEATSAREPRSQRSRPTTVPPPVPRATATSPARARSGTHSECIGDWQVEGVLGRGATGTVYAVKHREFGKRAALKLSHVRLDSGELCVKIFAREARVVQLIDHPAMPDVFATGMHDGRPFLVMERLSGETLKQVLERGAFERPQAFDLLIDICEVLAVAHNAQVVHRDLKLDNVFVLDRPAAAGYRVKLLDWCFACVLAEEDPLCGMIAGALNYLAPEQVRGQPITPATDVYSLGVLAYRLVLGERPFSNPEEAELVRSHVFTAPPDPTLLWPRIPKPLAQIMVRMLAKEPSERPTLHEVRAALCNARAAGRRRFSLAHVRAIAIALAGIAIGAAAIIAT